MKSLDVAHINPFLQSSISVIEMTTQVKLAVGKPGLSELNFPGKAFLLQVGVTGELKGQVLMAMSEESARFFAEKMMMGMQMDELNDMAVSALCELSNMVMGNTATIFASTRGENLTMRSDIQALRVPMLNDGEEIFALYICVGEE